jgi:hypothetical protein
LIERQQWLGWVGRLSELLTQWLVHGFLENDCQTDCHADDMDSKRVDSAAVLPGEVEDILRRAMENEARSSMIIVLCRVRESIEKFRDPKA